jgi:hypothetical protein
LGVALPPDTVGLASTCLSVLALDPLQGFHGGQGLLDLEQVARFVHRDGLLVGEESGKSAREQEADLLGGAQPAEVAAGQILGWRWRRGSRSVAAEDPLDATSPLAVKR